MISKLARQFNSLRRHWDEQSGQALVELALTVPLLVIVLLGSVEIARVAFVAIEVTDAAKAAVQQGAHSRANAGNNANIHAAAVAGAPDITLGNSVVTKSCICSDGSTSNCQSNSCASSNVEQLITVTTQTTFDPLIHLARLANYVRHPGPRNPESHQSMTPRHKKRRIADRRCRPSSTSFPLHLSQRNYDPAKLPFRPKVEQPWWNSLSQPPFSLPWFLASFSYQWRSTPITSPPMPLAKQPAGPSCAVPCPALTPPPSTNATRQQLTSPTSSRASDTPASIQTSSLLRQPTGILTTPSAPRPPVIFQATRCRFSVSYAFLLQIPFSTSPLLHLGSTSMMTISQ